MASQGPLYAASITQLTTPADNWVNITNMGAADGSVATVDLTSNGQSEAATLNTFGFTIPVGATITGVTAEINRKTAGGGDTADAVVRLADGTSLIGNDKLAAGTWPGVLTVATYGGAADLWGATLSVAFVNSTAFGIKLACFDGQLSDTASVDYVRLTVAYVTAGGGSQSRGRAVIAGRSRGRR